MTEFRPARPADGDALRELWGRAFPDAAHVVPLYEQDPGRAGRTLLACEEDVPVAVVYWLPRPIRGLAGQVHRVGCVSSVAALPSARGRGLVRRLLAMAVEAMAADGCAWSLLFTATPGVYSGWTTFDRPRVRGTFAAGHPRQPVAEVDLGEWPVLAGIHARHNESRPLTTVRTPGDWTERVPRWYGPDHQILLVGEPAVAYAVIDWRAGDVVEYACTTAAAEEPLFETVAEAARERDVRTGRLLVPEPSAVSSLFHTWTVAGERTGMARPINLEPEQVRAIVEDPAAVAWTADYF